MPCRVGMTQYPYTRRDQWKEKHPTLRNWKILGEYNSKKEAQKKETQFALIYGCHYGEGGRGPEKAKWYVYKFDY